MSSSQDDKISHEEGMEQVHNYIEQCLVRHMNLNEVKNALLVKARVKPEYTELAWKKLERANPEFFKTYYLRLLVKDQIVKFNQLLERQAELISEQSINPTTIHNSNAAYISQLSQNLAFYGQEYTRSAFQPEDMLQNSLFYSNAGPSSMHVKGSVDIPHDTMLNNTSSDMVLPQSSNMGLVQGMDGQTMNLSSNVGLMQGMYGQMFNLSSTIELMQGMYGQTLNPSSNMELMQEINWLTMNPSSNMGLLQAMNEQTMNLDTNNINGFPFIFAPNDNVLDVNHATGENFMPSYISVEPHLQSVHNNTFLGVDTNFESLGQFSKSFDPLNLTEDFPLDSGIENYSEFPFLSVGPDNSTNSLDPQFWTEQQDNRSLDTISKGLPSDNFGNN